MRTPVRHLFTLILLIAGATIASAGPITGRLVDPDGRPVPGAQVLAAQGSQVTATALTDASGGFTLRAPDRGPFEVRASIDGFRLRPISLTGQEAATDIGSLTLEVSAVNESVVVSAAQVDVPLSTTSSSVTVLSGDDLRARQVSSLGDALRLVPGLAVSATGGMGALTGVYPRGGESDYSLVLIDGVAANAFGGGFDFAQIPLVNVDRVEIVRGPQSALYGSGAIGSVIRVITRRGGPPTGGAAFEGGSFSTNRLTAGTAGSAGDVQWTASAERLASDNMNGERTAAGETVVNDDYERHSLAGGLGWTREDGTTLRGDVRYLTDDRGNPGPFGSDPGGTYSGIDAISRGTNDRWLSSISGMTATGHRVRLQGQVAFGRLSAGFESPFGPSESFTHRTDGRVQADIAVIEGLDASAGVDLTRESAGGTFIMATGPREVPVERGLAGFFGEGRWNHASRVFVTAGLRVERITRSALPGDADAFEPRPDFPDDTVVSVNPKLAASWFVRSDDGSFTKIRGSAGTGIRPPDALEIAYTDNPSLAPERSRSFDVGLDQAAFGGRALFEATGFFNDYNDLIVAVGSFNGVSQYRTDNISNARARGLELAGTGRARLAARVPVDLELRLSYTYLHTEILAVDGERDAPPPFVVGDPLLRRPTHQFGTTLMVDAGRLRGFLEGGGRGSFLDVDPSYGTFGGMYDAPGYSVWALGASWRIVRTVDVFGRITNLFDRTYEEALGYPALGRGAFAGLRIAAGR